MERTEAAHSTTLTHTSGMLCIVGEQKSTHAKLEARITFTVCTVPDIYICTCVCVTMHAQTNLIPQFIIFEISYVMRNFVFCICNRKCELFLFVLKIIL